MKKSFIYDICVIALFTAVIVICSYVTVPAFGVPFTLQTLGVLCAVGILGLRRGLISVLLYILLGVAGLPVFHGFQGGLGVLTGPTGGYIFGFLLTVVFVGLLQKLWCNRLFVTATFMFCGVLLCYSVGVLWYVLNFGNGDGLGTVLLTTVVPFVIPDLVKVLAAAAVTKRVSKYVR